jgi:hypothetical protein
MLVTVSEDIPCVAAAFGSLDAELGVQSSP